MRFWFRDLAEIGSGERSKLGGFVTWAWNRNGFWAFWHLTRRNLGNRCHRSLSLGRAFPRGSEKRFGLWQIIRFQPRREQCENQLSSNPIKKFFFSFSFLLKISNCLGVSKLSSFYSGKVKVNFH
jgi:hypothetical protein